jgi:XTP/dITP diphosphohydrolase
MIARLPRPLPVLLATRNRGKLAELKALLDGNHLALALPDAMPEVDETGGTFVENALLKARALGAATGAAALADDSGLEIAALGGAPGVRSARYAGDRAADADNVAKLLRDLAGAADRSARFRCALALVLPDGRELVAEGTWDGAIAEAPRGTNGFGYDPVFLVPGLGRTAAELPPELKQRLSHRAAAARLLIHKLSGL